MLVVRVIWLKKYIPGIYLKKIIIICAYDGVDTHTCTHTVGMPR